MNLERILILVVLELACSVWALPQYPSSQSGEQGNSQASGPNVQNNGTAVNRADGVQTEAPGQEPKPASRSSPVLSGTEVFAPKAGGEGRSYVLPAVQIATYANSNPGGTSGSSNVNGQTVLTGMLDMRLVRRGSNLDLAYAGGGFFNFGPTFTLNNGQKAPDHGNYHNLIAMETVNWRRWQVRFGDMFSYLPESAFGFYGFAGLDTFNVNLGGGFGGLPLYNMTLTPNQTIYTGYGRRLGNAAITDVEYRRGRSAVTITGVYGTLRFLDPGYVDSNSWTVFAGYNYSLTRRDVIRITGFYSDFSFNGSYPGVTSNGVLLGYGRKLTRNLYLELSGGPVLSRSTQPKVGNVTTTTLGSYCTLEYRVRKGSFGLVYSRFPTAGAGVLVGSENDSVYLTANRQLSHTLYGSLSAGYAYNHSQLISTGATQPFKYNTWQTGVTLSQSFGESVNGYLYFSVLRQVSGEPLSPGSDVFRYVAGAGLNWHARPHRLR